jgi:predicted transcriptional regulator
MDNAPPLGDNTQAGRLETEVEKQRRLAWEAEMIVEADADIAAGRLVDSAKVKVWIDSIGTDHELPVPYSGR